jgi:hypothetical protein
MTNFSVDFVSLNNFESLAAEISFRSQILCRIDRERRDGVLEVEFFHLGRRLKFDVRMKFPLPEFLSVVEEACSEPRQIPS